MLLLEEGDNNPDSSIDYVYLEKRERNNEAVRQSRLKLKKKMTESSKRINDLRKEREKLQEQLDFLKRRCSNIKQVILSLKQNSLSNEKLERIREEMKKNPNFIDTLIQM